MLGTFQSREILLFSVSFKALIILYNIKIKQIFKITRRPKYITRQQKTPCRTRRFQELLLHMADELVKLWLFILTINKISQLWQHA